MRMATAWQHIPSRRTTQQLLPQLLQALSFIHENNVLHRDIKPAPLPSLSQQGWLRELYPDFFLAGIDRALNIFSKDRRESADAWLSKLDSIATPSTSDVSNTTRSKGKNEEDIATKAVSGAF